MILNLLQSYVGSVYLSPLWFFSLSPDNHLFPKVIKPISSLMPPPQPASYLSAQISKVRGHIPVCLSQSVISPTYRSQTPCCVLAMKPAYYCSLLEEEGGGGSSCYLFYSELLSLYLETSCLYTHNTGFWLSSHIRSMAILHVVGQLCPLPVQCALVALIKREPLVVGTAPHC